jgi:hypothetical protein
MSFPSRSLEPREKRALILLGILAPLILGWYFSSPDETTTIVGAVQNIPAAEKRLARLRLLSAAVPGKEIVLGQVQKELAEREKGLIQADTAAQAQAQLLQIVRRIGRALPAPLDLRSTEIGQVKPFGDRYGEVMVAISFDARIEQLVNLLAELTKQKEMIGTTELRIGAASVKEKIMPVRMTLSGLVKRELVPDKKGAATF